MYSYINHRQLVRYEKNGPELYKYAQNNNISKNNFCKNASPRAELYLKFSDQLIEALKGQSHEIFDPWFFSLNGSPDSWAKAVLNIDSNSRSNSIRFFFIDNAKLKILFYCHGEGKITYDRFFERLLL
jgi:hypothetical protein